MGGGPGNTVSLLELVDLIGSLHGRRPEVFFEDWRTGDQRYYVSDFSRFAAATGWSPRVNAKQGVSKLYNWLLDFRGLATAPVTAPAMAEAHVS
jgi:CDP-paratose 2-epimerase